MCSRYSSPSFIASDRTPFADRATLIHVGSVFVDARQLHDPQVDAREMVIRVLVEMGFIEARRTCLSVAPSQRGIIPLLIGWCTLGLKTPSDSLTAIGVPSLGLRVILNGLHINVIIIHAMGGVETSCFWGVRKG